MMIYMTGFSFAWGYLLGYEAPETPREMAICTGITVLWPVLFLVYLYIRYSQMVESRDEE
jgi:hypothetical protein